MKIETVITAIVFFGVGFLAGYIYKTQSIPAMAPAAAVATQASGGTPPASPDSAPQGLPAGHPPLEEAGVIEQMEREAAQKPQDPQIELKLANYLYDKRLYSLAIEWYEKALALDPKNVSARTDLGTSLFYGGRAADAIAQYHQSLKFDPTHEPTMFNLIVVNLEGTHNVREADRFYKMLEERNPNYPGLDKIKAELDAAVRGSSAARAAP